MNYKGKLVAIEGINGAGKSTLVENLKKRLPHLVYTKEPYKLKLEGNLSNRVQLLAYTADRFQHLEEVILPALNAGKTVICDRYIDSSYVYQGLARENGFNKRDIFHLHAIVNDLSFYAVPSLTVFINANPIDAYQRINGRISLTELTKISEAYQKLYKDRPDVFFVGSLNSTEAAADNVAREIRRVIGDQPHCTSSNCQDNKVSEPMGTSYFHTRLNLLEKKVDEIDKEGCPSAYLCEEFEELDDRIDDIENRLDDIEEKLGM